MYPEICIVLAVTKHIILWQLDKHLKHTVQRNTIEIEVYIYTVALPQQDNLLEMAAPKVGNEQNVCALNTGHSPLSFSQRLSSFQSIDATGKQTRGVSFVERSSLSRRVMHFIGYTLCSNDTSQHWIINFKQYSYT